MTIQGNTLVFEYNSKADSKMTMQVGLILFVVPLIIGIMLLSLHVSPGLLNILGIIGAAFLIASVFLIVKAISMKVKQKKEIYISVSPQGVTTPKKKFIPIEKIDNCYVQFEVLEISGTCYKASFVVQLKSGKKTSFDFSNYTVPFAWNMENFHEGANKMLGFPLFNKSIINMHKQENEGRMAETKE